MTPPCREVRRVSAGEQAYTVSDGEGQLVFGTVLIRGVKRHLVTAKNTGRAPAFADRAADIARVGVRRRAHGEHIAFPTGVLPRLRFPQIGGGRDGLTPPARNQHGVPILTQPRDALRRVALPEHQCGLAIPFPELPHGAFQHGHGRFAECPPE